MLKESKKLPQQNPFEGREGLVYARVSSKKQELEGTGLASQEGRCIQDLRLIGVPYIKTFPDTFSGGGDFMERPAMRDLLAHIDKHPHKKFVVVFDDLKRFARDAQFHLKLRAAFRARGVILRCLNFSFDETPEGCFAELIMAGQAELERHQNKRQVIQKMKARLELGYWAFGVKRGYTIIQDPTCGKKSTPHRKDGPLLRKALEGFSTGIFSRKIDACRFLVDNGFWKKTTPERYVHLFDSMLKDPFYAGFIEYFQWDVTRRIGKHDALISLETFNLNQARLNGTLSKKSARGDVSEDFPLRGLLNCHDCGGHLCGGWTRGNGGEYGFYFCQNKSCEMYRKSISRSQVHDGFKQLLTKNTMKPEIEKIVSVVFDEAWEEEIESLENAQKIKSERKSELSQYIEKLTGMALSAKSGTVRQTYETQIEKMALELKELEGELGEVRNMNTPYQTALDKVIQVLKNPYEIWDESNIREKHRLFYFLFEEKLEYSKNLGYQTENIPSAVRLFEEFVTTNPRDVDPRRFELLTSSVQVRRSTN